MTRKRAKKLIMRYSQSRDVAETTLKKKPDGLTNADVVNSFRDNYIAHLANLLAEYNIVEKQDSLRVAVRLVACNVI